MSAVEKCDPLSQAAAAWLEARGLDPVLCERAGLTSGIGRDGAEWIAIPFERDGRRVNRKFRKIADKAWRQDKGGEQIFWRADCLTDKGLSEQPLLVTEGEFDALAAMQAGFWRVVSVPGGAPAQASEDARGGDKYAFIEAARAQLESVREIIIATDNDGPGHALLSDLTALLGPARCKFVSYPTGCKDLNDVLREHGEEGVRSAIQAARWVRVAGVHKLSELPPLPPLTIWRGAVQHDLDALLPICPGHLSVWTGIPGHGKSALVNAVMWSIAQRHGLRIAHGTFESTPQREYLEDLIAYRAGVPISDAACTSDVIAEARAWCEDRVVFLVTDGYAAPQQEELIDATLDWFFLAAQTAVTRHHCRLVVLDPWSQLEHARSASEPETSYIQRSIRKAKAFARTFDCHVAIIAHPTKQQRVQSGVYSMPEGYDISGSAHWYNGVDLGVTIHRDPELGEDGEPLADSTRVLVRAWKIKNHRAMGKPGDAYVTFDSRTGRYSPWIERSQAPRRTRKDFD